MEAIRVINLKDFAIGLVFALAEKEVLVIDKPRTVLCAAIESAYEAIRNDIERDYHSSKFHASIYETIGDSFEALEIIDYALGARLMTCEPPGQVFGVVRIESLIRAYFGFRPTHGNLYRKAAQAFLDYAE